MVLTDCPGSIDKSTLEAVRGKGRKTHHAQTVAPSKTANKSRLNPDQNRVFKSLSCVFFKADMIIEV